MTPSDIELKAIELHKWFCSATSQPIQWSAGWRFRWEVWIAAGHTGVDLRRVILYLRREINEGRRNHGSLKLVNLLDVERFEGDLGLVEMKRAGKFDIEARLPKAPE